jgi:hypothetical protein
VLTGGGVLLFLVCGGGALLVAQANKADRKSAIAPARPPVRPPHRPTPGIQVDPEPEIDIRGPVVAAGATLLGITFMVWGFICFASVAYTALVILLLAWVAKDARARGLDSPAIWVLVIFLTGPVGFLVYLASRPPGMLTTCSRCGNNHIMAAMSCPHCGQSRAS